MLTRSSAAGRSVGRCVQVRSCGPDFGFRRLKATAGALVAYPDILGLAEAPTAIARRGFIIRWNQPGTDLVSVVARCSGDSPECYETRRALLSQLVRQRSVSRGFTAVLSAPVELYQHQLDTMARVLADPVPRYLLADEVGLGKTIEAGLVLRQLLLDDAEATAVVSVPAALVRQWYREFRDRLLLADAVDKGRLRLVSHDRLARERRLREHALVVVDEAHLLLRHLEDRPRLRLDMKHTRGLLLLSATPMRGNLPVFLELLSLIDPLAFSREDLDSFRERVQVREKEAISLQVLTARRARLGQRYDVLADLLQLHGTDPQVVHLVQECRAAPGSESPTWSALASYIRETYRISRRMIRHRRNSGTTAEYLVAGRRVLFVPVADPARAVVDEFLERYREYLQDSYTLEHYARIVVHGLGGPRALLHHLESLQTTPDETTRTLPPSARALVETTLARLRCADLGTRQERALKLVQERLDQGLKVVVVGTSSGVARAFFDAARLCWGVLVGGHLAHLSQVRREKDVLTFLEASGSRVLVGDYTLEEGRNLQDAQVLVNLDLPLDPHRLEQRIGRLDRLTRRPEPTEVVVFTEAGSEWVTEHIRLLDEGVGIFQASVATLQRKLADLLDDVLARLPREGGRAFTTDLRALRESLEHERTDIDLLDELESVTVASDFDDASVADLRDAENDVEDLRTAFMRFTAPRGGLGLRAHEDPTDHLLRFRVPPGQRIPGLPDDAAAEVLPLLRRPRAFARDTATSRSGVAPLRLGDPLMDWLESYLRADERGQTCVIVRRYAGVRAPALWLSCDFLVEFDTAHLRAESDGVRRWLRRRGDALLPPTTIRTWTDPAGPAPTTLQENVLERPFDQGTDRVLRGPLWKDVRSTLPDWPQLCRLSGETALEQVCTMPALTSVPTAAARRAQEEVTSRLAVLHARSQRLSSARERASAGRDTEREKALGRALVQGVGHPAVSVIACAAVVLWPES
ncbi:MAG: protein DpdE [Pseudonocardiaceae bacterium]